MKTKKSFPRTMALAATVAALLTTSASAQLIGVDFNNVSPTDFPYSGAAVLGSAGDTWNNFTLPANTATIWTDGVNVSGNLTLVNGVTGSGVGLNVTVVNPNTTNDGSNGPAHGRFAAGATDVDIASSIFDLKRDYMFIRHSGGTAHWGPDAYYVVTLSGLAVETAYKLVIYAGGDNTGQGATFSNFSSTVTLLDDISAAYLPTSPVTQKPTPILGEDYIVADFTTGAAQTTFSFQAGSAGAQFTAISGLQLQVIPEPSSAALLAGALGVLAILRRRRR